MVDVYVEQLAHAIAGSSRELGKELNIDRQQLLSARTRLDRGSTNSAASHASTTSQNTHSRIVTTLDGWISLTISRPDDVELLPALFESDAPPLRELWPWISGRAAELPSAHIRDQAGLLGLSCAVPDEHRASPFSDLDLVVFPPPTRNRLAQFRVVDLSALWAGPLCAHLLGKVGAHVTTVEDPNRPDGSRFGSPALYAALHTGHELASLELRTAEGLGRLHELLRRADVVITSARPRAFLQLGIDPDALMSEHPITAWISITGFGPSQPNRAGYGDDAAVAGGLWRRTPAGPVFLGDAIADPLTGLTSAAVAMHALATRTRIRAHVSLASVAARASSSPRS